MSQYPALFDDDTLHEFDERYARAIVFVLCRYKSPTLNMHASPTSPRFSPAFNDTLLYLMFLVLSVLDVYTFFSV